MDLTLLAFRILFAVVLYVFLGTLLLFLWQDLRRMVVESKAQARPQGRLVVVALKAEDIGPEPGAAFALQQVTSMGRTSANTIVLSDPFVSAHHALLSWREGQWWLEDQGSKNGTTLGGELVTRPTIVSAGDLVGIGRVVLRLEVEQVGE